jgi:hypothetical protein
MLQVLLSFFVGGGLVATVAYIAQKGNATLTILVANIPVIFLLNILTAYRVGGIDSSLNYAKGALMYLPFYILFIVLTMWLIPRLGMPGAALPGLSIFTVPYFIKRFRGRFSGRLPLAEEVSQIADAVRQPDSGGGQNNAVI